MTLLGRSLFEHHRQSRKEKSERSHGLKCLFRVGGSDQDVDVLGRSRGAVYGHGYPAAYRVVNLRLCERGGDGVELVDQVHTRDRTTRAPRWAGSAAGWTTLPAVAE